MAFVGLDTFVADPNELDTMGSFFEEKFEKLVDAEERIFNVIDEMGQPDHWTGKPFDEFKGKCLEFRRTSLEQAKTYLEKFGGHFHKGADEVATTSADACNYIESNISDNTGNNGNIAA